MERVEEKSSRGNVIYEKIRALSVYGSNAVMRRVLTLLRKELDVPQTVLGRSCRPDINGSCRPDRCFTGEFSFLDSVHEFQQDDRRRSIFLDPQEALLAHLIDFFSDRLEVLEVRIPDRALALDDAESRALEMMRATHPLISVSHLLATSREELIDALRSTIYLLETTVPATGLQETWANASIFHDEATLAERCEFARMETGPTRWLNNGKTLQQSTRAVFFCRRNDGCCGNATYTKYGEWQWTTIWSDTGDPMKPPPTLPPDFQSEPWDNFCKVFLSPSVGRLTSDYGWRTVDGVKDFHPGLDIAAAVGTPVLSSVAGEVVHLNHSGGEGGVIIRNGNRVYTFWHITVAAGLSVGDNVTAGQQIGSVAPRVGPHLHLAIYDPPGGDWTKRADANSVNACRP